MHRPAFMLLTVLFGPALLVACRGEPSEPTASSLPSAAVKGSSPEAATPRNGFAGMPPVGTKAVCPVMGTEFEVTKNSEFAVYQGKTYVFCCPGCKPQFEAEPAKYIGTL